MGQQAHALCACFLFCLLSRGPALPLRCGDPGAAFGRDAVPLARQRAVSVGSGQGFGGPAAEPSLNIRDGRGNAAEFSLVAK
jgi:hypothetical protein